VKNEINVGFVVALQVGLIVPIVKNADRLTIKEISATAKGLRDRVLKRDSTSDDLSGGTFSISNMGMFGVEEFSAIINPPQVAILAVSAVKDKPIIKEGVIQPAKIMKVTLSADHRALDGVMVAKFLQRLKELLEKPLALIR
jgi:pyruvate dehydrogenase E2 component (dihydrolipoamide acetyltransferase)